RLTVSVPRVPAGLALVAKAGETFGRLRAAPALRRLVDDAVVELGRERRLDRCGDQLLGDRHRLRPGAQQIVDNPGAGRFELAGRADVVDEADLARHPGVEALAGQGQATGCPRADAVDQ